MKSIIITPSENTVIEVKEDTQFVLDFSARENKQNRIELIFNKEGVTGEILALYALHNSKISLETISNHQVAHTSCNTKVKSVLYDKAESEYVGKILIAKNAQQTNSYLDDSVLVVGKNTKNSSEPILEIEADDVKASHGATTGAIDPNEVYYLTSRGLSVQEARDLIVQGFFESLLSEIVDSKVQDEFRQKFFEGVK